MTPGYCIRPSLRPGDIHSQLLTSTLSVWIGREMEAGERRGRLSWRKRDGDRGVHKRLANVNVLLHMYDIISV